MARPTKRTPEVENKILQAVEAGNHRRVAAAFAGVSLRVISHWITLGKRSPGSVHGAFLRRLLDAEARAEIRAVAFINKAGQEDWKAAAWYLERKHPGRWGRKDAIAVGVGAGGVDGHGKPRGSYSLRLEVVREAPKAEA
jgi:hypothetical protein